MRIFEFYIIIYKCIIKKIKRIHYFIIILNKLLSKEYKIFAIDDKDYFYNYSWYSFVQNLKDKSKIKELKNISIMIIKWIINTLFSDIILFINNYFNNLKLVMILKVKEIAMCEIMKLSRKDFSNLLLKMK